MPKLTKFDASDEQNQQFKLKIPLFLKKRRKNNWFSWKIRILFFCTKSNLVDLKKKIKMTLLLTYLTLSGVAFGLVTALYVGLKTIKLI